jgi:Fic family protein
MVDTKYSETHPWITFDPVRLPADPQLWFLFGEAHSKIEHLRGVPLEPDVSKEFNRVFLAKGAWATAAIEGNTLDEDQARSVLDGTLDLPPSQEYLGTEIENAIAAMNDVIEDLMKSGPRDITPGLLMDWNTQILKDLDVDDGVVPGSFRQDARVVGPYKSPPADDVDYLVDQLCKWLQTAFEPPAEHEDYKLVYVIVKAIAAHVYFEWIHPFGDGNGRTGRLLEYYLLLSCGVPLPAAVLLTTHYNATRTDYYRQLDRASRSGGDLVPFISYGLRGFVDGLRAQIDRVKGMQMDVMWENFVHHSLPGTSEVNARQRSLVLALSRMSDPVPRSQLALFAPQVVMAYADKSDRTVTRDVNALLRGGLIVHQGGGYLANEALMRAFLPMRFIS